ncbi:MAG: transketolase [Pirellulales bacterium]|nr:transketolase [Pirellulales bacterium]
MASGNATIEQLAINTIRTLSMDAVQAAASGHPGTPMALAPVAYTLWNDFLQFDPLHPYWPARDRFVLSCGHASMLLYATLHLAGVRRVDAAGEPREELAISLDNIRNFRQWGSPCAGHPEHEMAPGIETTTGPLGQGIATSVGMAIAQRWLAAHFNRPGCSPFDYRVWALCSDGDLMEGIGGEAASLAGHLRLGNLCWIYDHNQITIEGETELAYSDDVAGRFAAYGWHTVEVADANDLVALRAAYQQARQSADRPTLVIVRSIIGYGAPNKQGTHGAHGAPLGDDEIRLTKRFYGWPEDEKFTVPAGVREHFDAHLGQRGAKAYAQWHANWKRYAQEHPQLAEQWRQMAAGELPAGWDRDLQPYPADPKGLATRVSSGKALVAVAQHVPWLLGGSADLAPSTMTNLTFTGAGDFSAASPAGRNFHFGIREHAMSAIANGMALSQLRPFDATFFVFSDYSRPALRMASILELPVIHVFTHDSIGVGEDGPTHQPIEHLAALRAIPRLAVIRPGDANEVVEAWRMILPWKNRQAALILSRQNLPTIDRTKFAPASGVQRGGYVLADPPSGAPRVVLIGTGSELTLCMAAYEQLTAAGVSTRVVSLPCWEVFDEQPQSYRDEVLPPQVAARIAVEAGIEQGWCKYLGPGGRFIGLNSFGASAPFATLYEKFGLTTGQIVAKARELAG